MEHLVGNGTHLYRRSTASRYHLVRTPMTITLKPSQKWVYPIGGNYGSSSPGGALTGIIKTRSPQNCLSAGAECVSRYLGRNVPPLQNWYQIHNSVSTGLDALTVWYQGLYATSAQSYSAGISSCEAFMQISSHMFTIPSGLDGMKVKRAQVTFTNGGGVECHDSALKLSAENRSLREALMETGGGYELWMPFYVTESRHKPWEYGDKAHDTPFDLLAELGAYRGERPLWRPNVSGRDGSIPTYTAPSQKTYDMGSETLKLVDEKRTFWITPYIPAQYVSSSSYFPVFVPENALEWGCHSVYDLSVKLELEMKEGH